MAQYAQIGSMSSQIVLLHDREAIASALNANLEGWQQVRTNRLQGPLSFRDLDVDSTINLEC